MRPLRRWVHRRRMLTQADEALESPVAAPLEAFIGVFGQYVSTWSPLARATTRDSWTSAARPPWSQLDPELLIALALEIT